MLTRVALLAAALSQVSDRELYDKIMAGAAPGSGHAAFVGERAELLLSQPARLGLRTRWVGERGGGCTCSGICQ
jgi:DNA-directed RNA polymerase I subunit RPA2